MNGRPALPPDTRSAGVVAYRESNQRPAEAKQTASNDSLLCLSRQLEELTERVAPVAKRASRDVVVTALMVRGVLAVRRDRARFFPSELFADPAWDILLTLTAAALERSKLSVSDVCGAAAVPTTTALRWIKVLMDAGSVVKMTDARDLRRSHLVLSEDALAAMIECLKSGQAALFEAAQ